MRDIDILYVSNVSSVKILHEQVIQKIQINIFEGKLEESHLVLSDEYI